MNALDKKEDIRKVINCFETGSIHTIYDKIYIYADAAGDQRQLTLSFGIVATGNMDVLIKSYISRKSIYSKNFEKYLALIKPNKLTDNLEFKKLLVAAAKEDPIFREEIDNIYDLQYWNKAVDFFNSNGFTQPLTLLFIMDSVIHSGSILGFLRKRFDEPVPVAGGDEKKWVKQFVDVRRAWLAGHSRKILRNTVYRMDFFLTQIKNNNWDLKLPVSANGIKIQ